MKTGRIVTVCDRMPIEPYYCLREFFRSLDQYSPLVLNNENMGSKFNGLGTKVKWLYKALKEGMFESDLVAFVDCWDLVFAASPVELFQRFLEMECDLVISTERNCFPADLKEDYDKLPFTSSFKYLNSGVIVGYTDKLLKLLEFMNPEKIPEDCRLPDGNMFHVNDQFLYQQAFLQQPIHIKLDYNQKLSGTLHQVTLDDLDFSEERIRNKETNTYPVIWHMNGSSKTDGLREPILKHLNLL